MFVLFLSSTLCSGEMDGEWVSVARVRGGEQQIGSPTHAVIKDGKFNTVRDGKLSEVGNIREVARSTPHQYDVEMTGDVEDSGKSFHGIFSVSGDTMFTCVNPTPGATRPADFTSTKKNGNILIVWIREHGVSKPTEESEVESEVR